jgi:hypothetical protein
MTFRTVVKCITIVWGSIIIDGLDCWVQTGDLCKLCRVTRLGTPPADFAGGTALFFGDWVLNPGEGLYTQTNPGTIDVHASGYQLSLP